MGWEREVTYIIKHNLLTKSQQQIKKVDLANNQIEQDPQRYYLSLDYAMLCILYVAKNLLTINYLFHAKK